MRRRSSRISTKNDVSNDSSQPLNDLPALEPDTGSVDPSPMKSPSEAKRGSRSAKAGVKRKMMQKGASKADSKPCKAKRTKGVAAKGAKKKAKAEKSKSKGKARVRKTPGGEPFPDLQGPSEEVCYLAHQVLCGLYGQPERDDCSHNEFSLLDSLCRTILSQNTTDTTSARAFASLKKILPTWKQVLHAQPGVAEEAIRCGGLADVKMFRIRLILEAILKEFPQHCEGGEPTLRFLSDWPTEQVKRYLLQFKGVGPKTVSCVLMFAMQRDEFPVDTHVWKIALGLGWVPKSANREATYAHLNKRIPDVLKYNLHVLLVKHGKVLKNALGKLSVAKSKSLNESAKSIASKEKDRMLVKKETKGVKSKGLKSERVKTERVKRAKKELTETERQMAGVKTE